MVHKARVVGHWRGHEPSVRWAAGPFYKGLIEYGDSTSLCSFEKPAGFAVGKELHEIQHQRALIGNDIVVRVEAEGKEQNLARNHDAGWF